VRLPNRARVLVLIAIAALAVVACARPPALPADVGQTQSTLSGAEGQDWLFQVSSYAWNDQGRAAADSLDWIAADATSPDPNTAEQAGQAAQAIAEFLVSRKEDLSQLSAGWLGLRKESLAELNPALLRAYSSVLKPYQGALVGDTTGVHGFVGLTDGGDSSKVRTLIAVLDSDTQAGEDFRQAAVGKIKAYLKGFAEGWAVDRRGDTALLHYAGTLAGAIAGGQSQSGNSSIEVKSARYWTNWANYEMAVALGAHRGDNAIADNYFTAEGMLKSPDDVTAEELVGLSNSLQNFVYASGLRGLDQELKNYYDAAAGK
jgi:hypothetical protein